MSRALAEALGDLADEVQGGDTSSTLATTAWQRGRRRRQRARVVRTAAVAAAAAAVVAMVVLALPGSRPHPVPPAADGSTVGYPERIAKPLVPRLVRQLPERGQPLAAVAFAASDVNVAPAGTWYAVGQGGELWHLPVRGDFFAVTIPAISQDGRRIAYSDERSGHYVIRDVVTGRLTQFPTVGVQQLYQDPTEPSSPPPATPYRTDFQTPTYFSPDGTRVAARGFAGKAAAPVVLVLGTDGSIRELPMEEGLNLAGWLDDDTLLALRTTSAKGKDGAVALNPIRLSLNGRRTPLPALSGEDTLLDSAALNQWSPSLSPDRSRLLLALDGSGLGTGGSGQSGLQLAGFDLASGAQVLSVSSPVTRQVTGLAPGTPVEWRGEQWVLPRLEPEGLRLEPEGDADPANALLVTDPRLQLTRLDLAESALAGPMHSSPWGTSVSTLSWRWPEALMLAGAAVLVLAWWGRRRVIRRGASGSGRSDGA